MGTFTLSYFLKKTFSYKLRIATLPIVLWLDYTMYQRGVYRRSMMKGQSRMFATRRAEIEAYAKKTGKEIDIWNY